MAEVEPLSDVAGARITVLHAPDRPGDIRDSQAGLARAESVLGYQPGIDVREGIRRLWAWYAANPRALETVSASTS